MTTENLMFSKKDMYLVEHNSQGRFRGLTMLPIRQRRKKIHENMHLTKIGQNMMVITRRYTSFWMILNFVTRYGATLSTLLILSASSIIFIRLTFLFGEIFLLISTTEKMFTVQDLSVRIGKIADSTLYLRQVGETWIHSRIASKDCQYTVL